MTEEKRSYTRHDSLNLSYICEDEDGTVVNEEMGRSLNVSENGILLETTSPNKTGNTLTLQMALADDLVDIKGHVVRCTEVENGKFHTGVEFSDLDEVSLITLKHFIQVFKTRDN